MILSGLDRYRVMEPLFEGVRVVLSYRGEHYSPAYVQGMSGAAFRIGGICPCAPTCSKAMEPSDLLQMLGYETELVALGEDAGTSISQLVNKVREEICAGRPALVWHAFTVLEWDVVCGFDAECELFLGRGSYQGLTEYTKASERRALEASPALGALLIKDKVTSFEPRRAELAALREAVRHAQAIPEDKGEGEWVFYEGLHCYDRWIADFKHKPEKKRETGDAYCLAVYRSSHRAAAGFLQELADKYSVADEYLLLAADCFLAEAEALDSAQPLLGWQAPEGPDQERNWQAACVLQRARDHYAAGIAAIEKALTVL